MLNFLNNVYANLGVCFFLAASGSKNKRQLLGTSLPT